jgi:hypothetical protein
MGDTPQKRMPADEILEKLFLDLFESKELRDFLYGVTGGPELIDSLPGGDVSRKEFARAAVDALQKRGVVNTDLFNLLLKKRPGQKDVIKNVSQSLNVEFNPAELDIPKQLVDDLESVLTQVTRQVMRMSSETSILGFHELLEILKLAISLGRPYYNSGDEQKCALIYRHTVQQIIPFLSEALDLPEFTKNRLKRTLPNLPGKSSPMGGFGEQSESPISGLTDKNNIAAVRNDLSETLNSCPEIDPVSADKVAWRLRYSFNRVFHFVKGLSALDDAINLSKLSSGYETERNVFAAINCGLAIYGEASDHVEITRAIQTSASLLSYAAKRINNILSSPFFMKISCEEREYITFILNYCCAEVSADNAYSIAWTARHGLEELLKLK